MSLLQGTYVLGGGGQPWTHQLTQVCTQVCRAQVCKSPHGVCLSMEDGAIILCRDTGAAFKLSKECAQSGPDYSREGERLRTCFYGKCLSGLEVGSGRWGIWKWNPEQSEYSWQPLVGFLSLQIYQLCKSRKGNRTIRGLLCLFSWGVTPHATITLSPPLGLWNSLEIKMLSFNNFFFVRTFCLVGVPYIYISI